MKTFDMFVDWVDNIDPNDGLSWLYIIPIISGIILFYIITKDCRDLVNADIFDWRYIIPHNNITED